MRLRALALLGGLMLLLPAAALAKSAGDEQYSDPFAGKSPAPQSSPTASVPSGSSQPESSGQLASSSSQGATAGDSSTDGSLPRTGLRAWFLAAMGGLMLLGGALLRLAARPLRAPVGGQTPLTLGRDVRLTRRL